ncbi:hypothetical protein RRG08_025031 [Elysia crispata]|uniref:Uncharacterized protein n=1 Tax=Elysia crispata TaxID=231223 RepID=A0AAE1E256_9GAST|nr:hypothetical protein RRG08_025031 [Elysia crispata]
MGSCKTVPLLVDAKKIFAFAAHGKRVKSNLDPCIVHVSQSTLSSDASHPGHLGCKCRPQDFSIVSCMESLHLCVTYCKVLSDDVGIVLQGKLHVDIRKDTVFILVEETVTL